MAHMVGRVTTSRAQCMVHRRICMYFWDLIEWSGGGVLGSAFWSLHPKVWLLKDCVANYCTWRVRYSPALTPEVHTELWETKKPAHGCDIGFLLGDRLPSWCTVSFSACSQEQQLKFEYAAALQWCFLRAHAIHAKITQIYKLFNL